jgi:hypothetical protein
MRISSATRLLAGAWLLASCTQGVSLFGRGREPGFAETLSQARALADGGRFEESDRALERYAMQHPRSADAVETLYWRAVIALDPSNQRGSIDTAAALLDEYLLSPLRLAHLSEATALRSLAREAAQLARVQQALRQARADARPSGDTSEPRPGDEASREVQRLRDELAAAQAELERIRKRLANPRP